MHELPRDPTPLRHRPPSLRRDLRDAQRPVTLAIQPALASGLSQTIPDILSRRCDMPVKSRVADLPDAYGQLLSGRVDLVLGYLPAGDTRALPPGAFEAMDLGVDRLIPVARADQSAAQLAQPLIAVPQDVASLAALDGRDRATERWVTTRQSQAALDLALEGIAIAWLPELLALPHLETGLLRRQLDLRRPELIITAIRLAGSQGQNLTRAWQALPLIEMGG